MKMVTIACKTINCLKCVKLYLKPGPLSETTTIVNLPPSGRQELNLHRTYVSTLKNEAVTVGKVSKYRVISGPYFPVF